jgi:hypothetical protein
MMSSKEASSIVGWVHILYASWQRLTQERTGAVEMRLTFVADGNKEEERIVDTYLDTTIPYPDAKAASSTYVGGPIKYELVGGCGLDDSWVAKNVVPKIHRLHHRKKTAIVLGKAILWEIFDLSTKELVDSKMCNRVVAEYERARLLHSNPNPVKKISPIISGHEGQLFIDEINEPELVDAEGDPQSASTVTTSTRGRILQLKNQIVNGGYRVLRYRLCLVTLLL